MQQTFVLNRTGGLEGVDFHALGFRCGLEIHHQIKTEKKLFCRCPAGKLSDEYHAEVLRHMRPTLSELGEYDGCALMEFKTKKEIIYRLNKESVCTYEMDDNPPFSINLQALDIALEIALLLNCKIVSEIHIARKQYLDGSIPTGFQRTTIVGVDGWIPYKERKVRIIQLGLEEDACREVSDIGHRITFLTDRLCMPLVEVVTAPDMQDPLEAAEVGGLLGTLLRLTGKVNRGAGSARQDVNVSITGGTRVEIKGVSRLGLIPRLTGFEACRQKALLNLREEIIRRGFKSEPDFIYEIKDVSTFIGEINHSPLRENFLCHRAVQAVCLRGLGGIFSSQLNPGWNFASEVAGRIRVIACLDQMPNLAHTDPDDRFSLSPDDRYRVFKWFNADERDVIVLIWGPADDARTGISETIIRVKEILKGVINETRQYRPEGLSDFERILPGPNRMYPDTDSPPTAITEDMIAQAFNRLPEPPWVKMERFRKLGLNRDVSWNLLHSPYLEPLEKAVERFPENASLLAQLTLQYFPDNSRNPAPWDDSEVETLLTCIAQEDLSKEQAVELLRVRQAGNDLDSALKEMRSAPVPDEKIDQALQTILSADEVSELPAEYIIGETKRRLKAPVSGARIHQQLLKFQHPTIKSEA